MAYRFGVGYGLFGKAPFPSERAWRTKALEVRSCPLQS